MGIKECIDVKFSEGLGIFDDHYGYPEIDQQEIYNGPTGKVVDIQGIQAHAGHYFIPPDGKKGKEFSFDIDECPHLHIAIKAEKGTSTCLFLMVRDKEPREHIRRFVVIGETPAKDHGIYNCVVKDCFTIEDDGKWQEYNFDLRKIREKQDDKHPYYPDAGSVCIIQFYSWTGTGEHTFHFNELSCKQESKPISESFIVRGIVATNVGVAAKGLKVIAIDKNPGIDVALGEDITDSSGNYNISYKNEVLQKMEKQNADIEIKIIDPEDESKIYGTSSVHFNADKDEEINLVLQTKMVEKTSEYNQIISDLKSHIKKGSFKDLREDEERQDISYLANKTGWDARLVAMVSSADKYSAESGIPADFYHALFRAGVPTDADGMSRTKSEKVKKIWEKAVEENIIKPTLKPAIEQNLTKFRETSRTHLLENAKPIGVSSLKELLGISLPDSSKQREFVELYYDHVGDMSSFWANAKEKFGKDTADKLQLDGKLGYLTVNNAELIGRLRSDKKVEKSPVDLIRNGLYKPKAWDTMLSNGIPVPKDMPGETKDDKKSNYINYMISMLKISYPTAVVAEMVHNNDLTVKGGSNVKKEVYEFLQDTQDKFQIGAHPVEKFIKDNNIELGEDALNEVKRVQRVYQVSPSDKAMIGLLDNNLDSALTIVQYDEKEFIGKFGNDLGGEDVAKMTYAKAHQVHSTVLNIAISYLTYRTSPRLYAISGAKKNVNPRDPDLISYPTLEEIFGSMDYCTCGHCKSVLSPAAYLVDLLQFIDLKKYDTDDTELLPRSYENENPIEVLLERRPDIEHIQLTCENTNTVLPYIDLVNEILEYYVVNHTLKNFKGHNVEEITSAELLASPQFVNDKAYTTLKDQVYPFNLPFNQPLSALRLYYDYVKVPLHEAMEKLRVNNNFDTPGGAGQPPYAWREIYNEFIGISQEEYKVLTTSGTKKLPVYFGEDEIMEFDDFIKKVFDNLYLFSWDEILENDNKIFKEFLKQNFSIDWLEEAVIEKIDDGNTIRVSTENNYLSLKFNDLQTKVNLKIDDGGTDEFIVKIENGKLNIYDTIYIYNAKIFSRKTGITYNELIEIIKTQFINPNNHLIPKLEKLRVRRQSEKLQLSFADINKFNEGNLSDEDFEKKIPSDLDRSIYGGDVKKWVKDNYDKIMSLVLLTPPEGEKTECKFNKSELRYSLPDNTKNFLKEIDYWRFLRFIRLWKKLGWTIEETDKAIAALYKDEFKSAAADNTDTQKQKLDNGFKDLVVKIAHVKKIKEKLNLKKENSLIKLLALWSNIDTHGNNSLYKQMFLHSSILKIDNVFDENGYGEYLQDANEKILRHLPALQAAFNVTAEELSLILNDAGFDDNSPLSLENVSRIYRYSFLAKALKLSIQEFMALKTMSGMDPFHELEDVHPSTLKFIELAQLIKQSDFKIKTLSYFLQHEDVTGKASPSKDNTLSLAKTLKDGLVRIEQEYKVEDDPTGEIAKSKMALVYENAVVDKFFGLLKGTTSYSVDYSHPQPELEQELKDVRYLFSIDAEFEDDLNNGIITEQLRDKFKNEGFPIDENDEVTKENGDNWEITDREKIYIVKKEEGKLNIYYISDKITYDHFQKRLIYQGVMAEKAKTKFEDAASDAESFEAAIQELYDMAQDDFKDFFDKYPDLKRLYDSYVSSNKPETEKISDILEDFLPSLQKKLKHLFIKQTLSFSVNVDLTILNELLEKQNILHSVEQDDKQAIEDFLKLEVSGVSAQYFFANNTSTTPGITLSGIAFNRGTVAKSDFRNNNLVLMLLNKEIIKEVVNYTDYVYFSDSIKDESQLKRHLEELNINSDKIGQILAIWRQSNNNLPANPVGSDAKISAIWKFYLEVPVNGNYNYYIETGKDAAVKISIDESEIPINEDNGIWQNQEAIELKAGRLYRVELEITEVKDKPVLKWESKGIARESIPVKYLYPYEQVQNFGDMYIRLLKVISIFERMGLEEKEIAFFSTALSFQIDEKGFLNAIPVTPNPDKNTVEALFNKLLDLLRYVDLKKSLNVKDETLVTILNDPDAKDENDESLLLKMTGWDKSSYEDLLKRFGWVQADLTDLNKFLRMNEAFEVVKKFGVPAAHLLSGTTNEPVPVTVRDIQNTLREKYDESGWLNALQPINDILRSRQRDALVSYILHEMQKKSRTKNIDTSNKLFEYFFIDVEMDPCMKTSRIKQANSTVQLFIQRCLMNLEKEVSPASIKADQWEWMKRYRVWEANRKIFLYPENWLEPELRDNKSPFFKDLESELLQADITDELAETALLNYLEKLDEVSKLEISGMYLQENEANNESDDILHVFGRTTGASRKYYYRRFDGNWTPWEKVDLDIEDNPILPVVWKNRLFLFWLNIVRKGSGSEPLPKNGNKTKPAQLDIDDLNKAAKETIEINLSWSEYYNNKWQPRKTSDYNKPIKLGGYGPEKFKRDNIVISSLFDLSELSVLIYNPYYNLDYSTIFSFKLFNKHNALLENGGDLPSRYSNIYIKEEELFVQYSYRVGETDETYETYEGDTYEGFKTIKHGVFKKLHPYPHDIIKNNHHGVSNFFESPFFYQDTKHVFFVKPEGSPTIIPEYEPVVLEEEPVLEPEAKPQFSEVVTSPQPVVSDAFHVVASEAIQEAIQQIYLNTLEKSCARNPMQPMCLMYSFGSKEAFRGGEVGTRPVGHNLSRVVSNNRTVTYCDERIGPIGSRHANAYMLKKSDFETIRKRR